MSTTHAAGRHEETEAIRRRLYTEINSKPCTREELEREQGQVWSPSEVARDFELLQFSAPLVVARRREDMKLGSLYFQHSPRFYWGWREDEG